VRLHLEAQDGSLEEVPVCSEGVY